MADRILLINFLSFFLSCYNDDQIVKNSRLKPSCTKLLRLPQIKVGTHQWNWYLKSLVSITVTSTKAFCQLWYRGFKWILQIIVPILYDTSIFKSIVNPKGDFGSSHKPLTHRRAPWRHFETKLHISKSLE